MQTERLELLWDSGNFREALEGAHAAAETDDPLTLAEALLRCAATSNAPEWEEAARLAVRLRERVWPAGHSRAGYAAMPLADLLRRQGTPWRGRNRSASVRGSGPGSDRRLGQ